MHMKVIRAKIVEHMTEVVVFLQGCKFRMESVHVNYGMYILYWTYTFGLEGLHFHHDGICFAN